MVLCTCLRNFWLLSSSSVIPPPLELAEPGSESRLSHCLLCLALLRVDALAEKPPKNNDVTNTAIHNSGEFVRRASSPKPQDAPEISRARTAQFDHAPRPASLPTRSRWHRRHPPPPLPPSLAPLTASHRHDGQPPGSGCRVCDLPAVWFVWLQLRHHLRFLPLPLGSPSAPLTPPAAALLP